MYIFSHHVLHAITVLQNTEPDRILILSVTNEMLNDSNLVRCALEMSVVGHSLLWTFHLLCRSVYWDDKHWRPPSPQHSHRRNQHIRPICSQEEANIFRRMLAKQLLCSYWDHGNKEAISPHQSYKNRIKRTYKY